MSETDDIARGNHVVPTEWAQQLERERDEARESTLRIDVLNFKLRKELDDAKSKIKSQADRIRYLEGATNHAKGTPLSVALRERDEANEDLHKQLVQFDQLFDEAEKIRIERDEAREEANKLSGAYEDATNYYARIIELKEELDEAREELNKILKNE